MTDRSRSSEPDSSGRGTRPRARSSLVIAAMAGALLGSGAPPAPEPAPVPPPLEVAGTWAGRATITVDLGTPCRYEGPDTPPAVTIDVRSSADKSTATVALTLAAPQASACPTLHESFQATDVAATATTLSFRGPGDMEWSLGRKGDVIQGIVSSAERSLSGEVRLLRRDAPSGPAPKATAKAKKGTSTIGVAAGIVTANVVALGGLALVNKLADDSGKSSGQASCSPRQCRFAGIADPCFCEPTITAGAKCGPTQGGVPLGGRCSPGDPCQSNLSCNTGPSGVGICEDSIGRCPY
jgi:hypothetical protein